MAPFSRPIPFGGTPEQIAANVNSHHWGNIDDEVRCWDCDCKVWHAAAHYPCGTVPPRETVEVEWSKFDTLIEGLVKDNG